MSNFHLADNRADFRPTNFGRALKLAKLEDTGDALCFSASPFRQWHLIVFAFLLPTLSWLTDWLKYLVYSGRYTRPFAFLLSYFSLLFAAVLIGRFACRYVVRISATELRIRMSILGLGWTRVVPLAGISNLHFAPVRVSPRRYGLAFKRDALTCYLPIIIRGDDASQIRSMFEGRLPQLDSISRSLNR